MEWISVKDKEPKEDAELICFSDCGIVIGSWSKDLGWEAHHNGFYEYVTVTHWMPLPEPPQGLK